MCLLQPSRGYAKAGEKLLHASLRNGADNQEYNMHRIHEKRFVKVLELALYTSRYAKSPGDDFEARQGSHSMKTYECSVNKFKSIGYLCYKCFDPNLILPLRMGCRRNLLVSSGHCE